jgi:hypothetical protein
MTRAGTGRSSWRRSREEDPRGETTLRRRTAASPLVRRGGDPARGPRERAYPVGSRSSTLDELRSRRWWSNGRGAAGDRAARVASTPEASEARVRVGRLALTGRARRCRTISRAGPALPDRLRSWPAFQSVSSRSVSWRISEFREPQPTQPVGDRRAPQLFFRGFGIGVPVLRRPGRARTGSRHPVHSAPNDANEPPGATIERLSRTVFKPLHTRPIDPRRRGRGPACPLRHCPRATRSRGHRRLRRCLRSVHSGGFRDGRVRLVGRGSAGSRRRAPLRPRLRSQRPEYQGGRPSRRSRLEAGGRGTWIPRVGSGPGRASLRGHNVQGRLRRGRDHVGVACFERDPPRVAAADAPHSFTNSGPRHRLSGPLPRPGRRATVPRQPARGPGGRVLVPRRSEGRERGSGRPRPTATTRAGVEMRIRSRRSGTGTRPA